MLNNRKIGFGGFSMVEVLVAVGVLAIGFLAFLPSYSFVIKRKSLDQSVEDVKDIISTVRSTAVMQSESGGGVEIYRYTGLRFTRNSSTYEAFRSMEANKDVCKNLGSRNDVIIDYVRNMPDLVVAKMLEVDNPTCFFFEYGTGNVFVTKGESACVSCSN